MRFGLSEAQLAEITAILQKYPEVSRGLIFGSRAMGNYGVASDIDLAIKGKDVTFKTAVNISSDLDDSELPFLCDVVNYHTIDHPPFKEHIDTEGVIFYRRGWQEVYLDDAVEINPTVKILRGELYPRVDMQMLVPENKIVATTQTKIFNGGGSRFVDGDTLMARITPCLENGKISRFKAKGQLPAHGSTEFIVMRNKDKITHPDFVYYLIVSHQVKPYAIAQMTGSSGRQRVPTNKFKTIRVKLPPIKQQEAISTSLGVLDDKIELNKSINTTLENMAEAIFKSWLVDFDPVHAKQLAHEAGLPMERAAMAVIAALCSPREFVENFSAMDEALTKRLASMSSTERDTLTHTASLFPDEFEESGMGAIPRGWRHIPCGATDITELGLKKSSAKLMPKGAVVISSRAPIGYIAFSEKNLCTNQGFKALVPRGCLGSHFLYSWSKANVDKMKAVATGSTFKEITGNSMKSLEILVPERAIISVFETVMNSFFVKNFDQESKNLAHLRDTLLPKLIEGEIDMSALLE